MTEPDRPPIALEADACLNARNKFSTCDLCIKTCPVNALRLGPPIALDEKVCIACGACLPVCPVGALTGKDSADDLARCVSQVPDARVVELACTRHTAAETGPAESTAVVQTEGCLAALGASAFERLLTNGTERLVVRLDACAGCSIGSLQPKISSNVAAVNRLTAASASAESSEGAKPRIVEIHERDASWKTRQIIPVKNPPVSRRAMFRSFVSEGPRIAAQVLPTQDDQATGGKAPPLERRRLIAAMRRQASSEGAAPTVLPDNGLGFVRLAVDAQCTACGVCARVCPTGAIRFEEQNMSFRLTFAASACTDCGACLDLCEPNALSRDGVPSIGVLLSTAPILLRTGALSTCDKCGAKFATTGSGRLCPTCDFRVHNPFGSRQPAKIMRRP